MTDPHFASATDQVRLIKSKKISALELLDHYLERIERFNPSLNAIVWQDAENARARAQAADAAFAAGDDWGPLHGLPMTVKEAFNLTGSPTTWGDPALKNNLPDSNALYVDRLLAAGANIFGKTNVPLDLADWQSFNAIYGTANNPWNLERTPGGSSGGSAAALAAGLTALEAGSDIGASIRNPAHYCGVFGHKPTYGIVPGRGHSRPDWYTDIDIAVVGPMARSAVDLELELDIVAGPDHLAASAWRLELPPARHTDLKDFRVAIMLTDPVAEVDRSYQDRLQHVADELAKAGATVSDRARPDVDTARAFEVYVTLLRAATSAGAPPTLVEKFEAVLADPEADQANYLWRMARGTLLPHREWMLWDNEREAMRFKWAEFFRDWDILLCPAAASAAWPHDQAGERYERTITVNNVEQPTTTQLFWAGFMNMVYLPSTVAPAGLTPEGLPVGLQAVAAEGEDRTSIAFCKLTSREIAGFQPPPGY